MLKYHKFKILEYLFINENLSLKGSEFNANDHRELVKYEDM